MLKPFYFFLSNRLKQKQIATSKNSGFTLIELLIAMILAVLVITPLLGFMIDILNNDRKEQAKVMSEQEVQQALDYIAQDLQQAIYIYDAKGIQAIKSQLPDKTDRVPVLVFWKRQFKEDAVAVPQSTTNRKSDDGYVYSLVAYYLVKSDATNKIWSDQFRIAKFEVNGGILDQYEPFRNGQQNYARNQAGEEQKPDAGFEMFKLNDINNTGTLEDKMNNWKKKEGEVYARNTENGTVLIDYVDRSPSSATLKPVDCSREVFNIDEDKSVPAERKADKKAALLVPATSGKFQYTNNSEFGNGSFYACVDTNRVSAKIFIRGNAYARIDKSNNLYNDSRDSYFPSVNAQVKGKGIIGAN